jgi:hypothetical protein
MTETSNARSSLTVVKPAKEARVKRLERGLKLFQADPSRVHGVTKVQRKRIVRAQHNSEALRLR